MSESSELVADVYERCMNASTIACRPLLIATARALAFDVSDNRLDAVKARTILCELCIEFNVEAAIILYAFRTARSQYDSEFVTARCEDPRAVRPW